MNMTKDAYKNKKKTDALRRSNNYMVAMKTFVAISNKSSNKNCTSKFNLQTFVAILLSSYFRVQETSEFLVALLFFTKIVYIA